MRGKPGARVCFRTGHNAAGLRSETVWAYDLGRDRYRVANIPFMIYGVSAEDIVLAPGGSSEGWAAFERVIIKSGNRTVWVVLDEPPQKGNGSERLISDLTAMGCGYEGADPCWLAFTVPPATSLDRVLHRLECASVSWEVADRGSWAQ